MVHSPLIRSIYLYVATFVGLMMIMISFYNFVDLGLKATILPNADNPWEVTDSPPSVIKTGPDGSPVPVATTTFSPADQAAQKQERDSLNQRRKTADRERRLSGAIALLFIGLPLYTYHWMIIKQDRQAKK